MWVSWTIRYLDRTDKELKDRLLCLDTDAQEPAIKAAVEFVIETRTGTTDQGILKYRHLFVEASESSLESRAHVRSYNGVFLPDYFEDEEGNEITLTEIIRLQTGNPNLIPVPSGAKQHDIEYMLSEDTPMPVAEVNLSSDEVRVLAYFKRDFEEFEQSAFMKDGPGSLYGRNSITAPEGGFVVETAVTDDEIRSFTTTVRRLYMTGKHDAANFLDTAAAFVEISPNNPTAKWVAGVAKSYETDLSNPADVFPFVQGITFTRKRLIDVFLYTRYAHQPDERRQRQYVECLGQVNGDKSLLTYLFLSELWKTSLQIGNAGRVMTAWFGRYCEHHEIEPDVIPSLRHDAPGLGTREKDEARKARLFRERSGDLAFEIWKQKGRPEGGPMQFYQEAKDRLSKQLGVEGV